MSLDFILGSLFGFGTFALVMITMQHALNKTVKRQLNALNRFAEEFDHLHSNHQKDNLK